MFSVLFRPPSSIQDEDQRRLARILLIILATMIGASLVGVIGGLLQEEEGFRSPSIQALLIVDVILVTTFVLVKRGYVILSSYVLPIVMLVMFTYLAYVGSGIHNITTHGYLLVIALASLLLGKNAPIIFSGLTMLAMAFLVIAEVNGWIVTPYGGNTSYADLLILVAILSISAVLLRLMMSNLEESAARARMSEEALRVLNSELEKRVADRTKDLEKARQEADAARTVAEKASQIKSQFLANMSHELRTPLNAILNFTGFVLDGVMGPVTEAQNKALNQAVSSGKHLLSLINDVLDISKIETGSMDLFIQEVDLNETLTATASLGAGLVKDKPITFVTEIEADLPTSYGDRRRLRQVFLNLLANAVKFTPEGTITITAKKEEAGVHVSICDTGIGIAPENHEHIFETFRQVKADDLPDAVGTGLGLSITKYFVESHGGSISVESEPGKGSTFHVRLPILTEEKAKAINQIPVTA